MGRRKKEIAVGMNVSKKEGSDFRQKGMKK